MEYCKNYIFLSLGDADCEEGEKENNPIYFGLKGFQTLY